MNSVFKAKKKHAPGERYYDGIFRRIYTGKLMSLGSVNSSTNYETLATQKIARETFNTDVIDDLYQAMRVKYPDIRLIMRMQVWRAVRDADKLPKREDLLYRFLHGKVRTGRGLYWLEEDNQLSAN